MPLRRLLGRVFLLESEPIGDPGFMNPTGAPEPFWDFCKIVKGLFILVVLEHPVGVRS